MWKMFYMNASRINAIVPDEINKKNCPRRYLVLQGFIASYYYKTIINKALTHKAVIYTSVQLISAFISM